jgi:hypothetical protein
MIKVASPSDFGSRSLELHPPTFPARPVSGGPFPKAREKAGHWIYEPKYNGWRALVHLETGAMFNRKGERLSINGEFTQALRLLRSTLDAAAFKWADVEALERRHGIGRGCLIVLDVIPEPAYAQTPYGERRAWIAAPVLPILDYLKAPWTEPCLDRNGGLFRAPDGFPLISIPPIVAPDQAWNDLKEINGCLGCEFYEGLVAKRIDSVYPIQLRGPEEAFPFWVKHRWQF